MNTMVSILLGECESIIAETENVYDFLTVDGIDTKVLDSLEFDDIRSSAEALNELVLHLENDYFSVSKEELEDESITLYQNVKYILSEIEDEYSFLMTDDVAKSFSYIRASVNTIRSTIVGE